MIYGFVRQSGGQVRIYSEVGKGTTMCLYFPRWHGRGRARTRDAAEPVESGFGETVLVVDDDATVRMLIAEVLTENHYRLLEAGDGPSALKILEARQQRIDLMVTDVGLPGGMNGRQLADAARQMRPELKSCSSRGMRRMPSSATGIWSPAWRCWPSRSRCRRLRTRSGRYWRSGNDCRCIVPTTA